jgi:Zn-finger nucleic acid-binding protein
MTRINFERVSGILLDRCRDDGIWFDANELDAVLRWVKLGGERMSDERRQDEERARAAQLRFKVEPKTPEDARSAAFKNFDHDSGLDALPSVVKWLLEL